MKKLLDKLQPAVRLETTRVGTGTAVGVVCMWAVFGLLHLLVPDQVPFDYRVILGGLGGGLVAVLNFFLMALTVQKVVSIEDESSARNRMKASYTQRMMMQGLWCILAIVLPCFQFAAGMIPLLFPTAVIKIVGIFWQKKANS
ncbi:MAG: ATP synthase subunit I [Eubacteriales bacterium]|nr:ATP synthase subunit I [Eubacteriales bacterium]